jgi:hypothetical protein
MPKVPKKKITPPITLIPGENTSIGRRPSQFANSPSNEETKMNPKADNHVFFIPPILGLTLRENSISVMDDIKFANASPSDTFTAKLSSGV